MSSDLGQQHRLLFRRGSSLGASSPSSGWSGRHLDLEVKSTTDCSQSAEECAKFLEIKETDQISVWEVDLMERHRYQSETLLKRNI
jgi:hypothetical protein